MFFTFLACMAELFAMMDNVVTAEAHPEGQSVMNSVKVRCGM